MNPIIRVEPSDNGWGAGVFIGGDCVAYFSTEHQDQDDADAERFARIYESTF